MMNDFASYELAKARQAEILASAIADRRVRGDRATLARMSEGLRRLGSALMAFLV